MLTIEQALERVLSEVVRLPVESVPLAEAYDRVLAEDVVAVRDVPEWPASEMDGYAVRAEDTADGEFTLGLHEVVAAGDMPTHRIEPGTTSAVMTGAPIPEGADAVVKVEDTDHSLEGVVVMRGRSDPGQFVRPRSADILSGTVLLKAGRRLTPAALGLVASQGMVQVLVHALPVVAILCTGDEVVAPGKPLAPGQLYSSNNASLGALVRQLGCVPLDAGIAADDLDSITTRLSFCLREADVVITTGGVSVGEFDLVKQAFASLGVGMDFWRVRVKPGKPLAFGAVAMEGRRVPVFGLPGPPVSCMVGFLQFVRPWLLQTMGLAEQYLPTAVATASEDMTLKAIGRVNLVRVVIEGQPGALTCRLAGSQRSGVLTPMARAHGLAVVPIGQPGFAVGEPVHVQVFDWRFLDRTAPLFPW